MCSKYANIIIDIIVKCSARMCVYMRANILYGAETQGQFLISNTNFDFDIS